MTTRLSHSVRTVRRTEDTHCRGVGQKASDRQHSELEDVPRETERARRSNLFAGSHTGLGRPHCLMRKSSYMVHWYSQTEFLRSSSYLCPCMLVCLRRMSKEDRGAMGRKCTNANFPSPFGEEAWCLLARRRDPLVVPTATWNRRRREGQKQGPFRRGEGGNSGGTRGEIWLGGDGSSQSSQ